MDQAPTAEQQAFISLQPVLESIVQILASIPAEAGIAQAMTFLQDITAADNDEESQRQIYLDILQMIYTIQQAK